ncbi:MAG: hypothetical protein ACYC4U_23585 [Pirellulaceae bacterium]
MMARSPIEKGPNADGRRTQERPAQVTMVVDPTVPALDCAGSGSNRAAQLSETISVGSPAKAVTSEVEEPTIEEYMAALLARSNQSTPLRSETIRRPAPAVVGKVVPSAPPQGVASPPVAAVPLTVAECRTAFSELRELANISARSTFNAHLAHVLVVEMRSKRLVAIVAILASLTLISLTTTMRSPTYLAAVVAVAAACVWSLNYLSLARDLSRVCAESDAGESSDG